MFIYINRYMKYVYIWNMFIYEIYMNDYIYYMCGYMEHIDFLWVHLVLLIATWAGWWKIIMFGSFGGWIDNNSPILITKKPDLNDPVLRAKLAKGMGHNYYGEPAWPNDLLYIFPVVILGTIACNVGLAVLEPSMIGEPADPFATPLEILPEWYFFPVFQILRTVPNKLLGVLLMVSVPTGLLIVPFLENVNKFQNPFRRPVATTVFLVGTAVALWLGIGATLPIEKSLTLGLF